MSAIPAAARKAVTEREQGRCARCRTVGTDLHHRQRRREGGHWIYNLVLLCRVCHSWAHANPAVARESGWIVSAHEQDVPSVPLRYWSGPVRLDANGGVEVYPQ